MTNFLLWIAFILAVSAGFMAWMMYVAPVMEDEDDWWKL